MIQPQTIKGKQTTDVPYSQDELNNIRQAIADLPSSSISTWCLEMQVQDSKLNILATRLTIAM